MSIFSNYLAYCFRNESFLFAYIHHCFTIIYCILPYVIQDILFIVYVVRGSYLQAQVSSEYMWREFYN